MVGPVFLMIRISILVIWMYKERKQFVSTCSIIRKFHSAKKKNHMEVSKCKSSITPILQISSVLLTQAFYDLDGLGWESHVPLHARVQSIWLERDNVVYTLWTLSLSLFLSSSLSQNVENFICAVLIKASRHCIAGPFFNTIIDTCCKQDHCWSCGNIITTYSTLQILLCVVSNR